MQPTAESASEATISLTCLVSNLQNENPARGESKDEMPTVVGATARSASKSNGDYTQYLLKNGPFRPFLMGNWTQVVQLCYNI